VVAMMNTATSRVYVYGMALESPFWCALQLAAWDAAAISLAGLALSCADWRLPETSVVGLSEAMAMRRMVSEVDLMSFWQYVVSWRKVQLWLTSSRKRLLAQHCVQG
jgi:hypothetical protein